MNPHTLLFLPFTMDSLTILLLLMLLLTFFSGDCIAGEDGIPVAGFNGIERDALYALKVSFNHPLLLKNWTGLQCYMNDPPYWYGIQCFDGRVTGISLEAIGLTGKVNIDALVNLTELTFLSFKDNWISGNLMDFSSNRKLTHLHLSGNKFVGPISNSLLGLEFLESLQLQDNDLTGPIPGFTQFSLTEFNVSNNKLSGEIPDIPIFKSFRPSSYIGNPGLCGPPLNNSCYESQISNTSQSTNTSSSDEDKKREGERTKISLVAVFVILDVIALILVVLLFVLYYTKAKKYKKERKETDSEEEREKKNKNKNKEINEIERGELREVRREEKGKLIFMEEGEGFELGDLLKASAQGLGKGSFGSCYMATIRRGRAFVVKRLRNLRPLSIEDYAKQMKLLADLKHPNLLHLVAYYYSNDEKLLVYAFAQKGNLFNRLHGGRGKDRIPFKWSSRLSAAQGVAQAIEFLHLKAKSQTAIPHGNLKPSNILLDENDAVLVSDYGLTSLISTPIASQRMVAYKSPEYQHSKKVSKKSDVWSYGCFLLELLTGRISIYSAPQGINGVDLCNWVHRAVREEWTAEIFDPEISMQRNSHEGMLRLLQIALRCCEKSPEKRPDMVEVVREVKMIKVTDPDDNDSSSFDQSLTEDSISTNGSGRVGDER